MGDVYAEYMRVLKRPDVVLASNKAREKAISEFKEKYPNADMSKFDFEVDVDLSGKVTGVVVNYKVNEDTSYAITSDGFKSNPEWVKFLYSSKSTGGWPRLWDSSGTVYELQPLVFPAEPYYNERKFGSYRVRKDDDDYLINKFRPHVKLPYNFNNFRIYINENSYFMSNLPDAGVGWDEGPNLTNKDVRKVSFNTIP